MPAIEALRRELEAVAQAARQGDLRELARLGNVLEVQSAALEHLVAEEAQLHQIRALAAEASTLLEATLRGVAAARARLAEIRAVKRGAGTYGDDGQRRCLTLPDRDGRRL